MLVGYIKKIGYAFGWSLDMDESIFKKIQVLDIQQYTPLLDVCYVRI
jgi:hypothetical protein